MNNKRNFLFFALVLAILPLLFLNQTFLISIFSQVLIFSIAALGLNILIGFAGQLSIGHAAFLAVGAYVSAVLTRNFNFPFLATVLLSGGVAGGLGLVLGFPALRLKGFYLAIATMAFGVAIEQFIGASDYLGGHIGFRDIPSFDIFWIRVQSDLGKYYMVAFFAFVLFLIAANILQSKTGRAFKAIRESEFAARSSGVNIARYKLIAFVISAVYAGIAGALYAHTINYIAPTDFGLGLSINLLAMIVVGGLASLSGNFIGSILMVAIPFLFSRTNLPMSIIFGTMLVVVVLFFPRGLAYGLYILNWKFLGIPYARLRQWYRSKKGGGKQMFITVGGTKIHYEIGGNPSGEPVFFLHGNFGSWRWFQPVMERMEKSPYKGVALDLPGFGDSSKPERPISIDNYAREFSQFVQAFEKQGILLKPGQKIKIVAHSLGGAVALQYAVDHPQKVEKMLLIDPCPVNGLKTPEEYYPILSTYRDNVGLLQTALGATIPSGDPDKLLPRLVDDALQMDKRAFTENARALERFNVQQRVQQFSFPVHILVGELDSLVTPELLHTTLLSIPQASLQIIENTGHSVPVEKPDRFLAILQDFFGQEGVEPE